MYVDTSNVRITQKYITSYLVDKGAWIGINEITDTEKHRWRWGFSTKICSKYDWYGEEPEYHTSNDYHCGIMWQTYRYHWHLESCHRDHYYICEMKLVSRMDDLRHYVAVTIRLPEKIQWVFFFYTNTLLHYIMSWRNITSSHSNVYNVAGKLLWSYFSGIPYHHDFKAGNWATCLNNGFTQLHEE